MGQKIIEQAESRGLPRREFIRNAATLAAVAGLSPASMLGCQATSSSSVSSNNSEAMDQALEMMAGLEPFANHGPMAAEALVSLGRPESIISFVNAYKKRFTSPYPSSYQTVTSTNWREALGDSRRISDWAIFFNRQLKEAAWPKVLDLWSGRLAPGLAAAAAHGLIRTAHATRSLSVKETELRLEELAEGLSYWAAYYQELPENPNASGVRLKPLDAIKQIPLVPVAKRRGGSVTNGLRAVNEFAPFAAVSSMVETTGRPETVISELTQAFATAYVRKITPGNLIILLHAVTCTSGLRSLLPYLSATTAQRMLHYGWLVGAALYSIGAIDSTNGPIEDQEIKRDDLIERAVATREEHAIKFTEACLREYSINSNTVYLQAAKDALGRLPSF